MSEIRIPCEKWENFFSSILATLLLPLIPLLLDFSISKNLTIDIESLVPMAAFFILALGSSSKSKSFLYFSIISGVFLTAFYPSISSGQNLFKYLKEVSGILIILSISFHIIERFRRHILHREPFLDFWYGTEEIRKRNDDIRRLQEKEAKILTEIREEEKKFKKVSDEEEKKSINEKIIRLKKRWKSFQTQVEEKIEERELYDDYT